MNELLIKLSPTELNWISIREFRGCQDKLFPKSYSYHTILIATEKHGNDLVVNVGCVQPNDDYTDFKIYSKRSGVTRAAPDFEEDLDNIVAIAIIDYYIT